MVVSERMLKELGVEPIARLKSYHVSGLEPRIMGVGPIYAVPEALKKAGLTKADIARYELNEAFASQSVAVLRELDLDPTTVNVHGGAIALGHPLGCTGRQAHRATPERIENPTRQTRHRHDVRGHRTRCGWRV